MSVQPAVAKGYRHPYKPCLFMLLRFKLGSLLINSQKYFLHHVLRIGPVPHNSQRSKIASVLTNQPTYKTRQYHLLPLPCVITAI